MILVLKGGKPRSLALGEPLVQRRANRIGARRQWLRPQSRNSQPGKQQDKQMAWMLHDEGGLFVGAIALLATPKPARYHTAMLIAFHKPFDVLSQFTRELPEHRTLADFGLPSHVYPIGRLDRDSEGLLLLSDEAHWTDRLLNPRRGHPRMYRAQVEGLVTDQALRHLSAGVKLKEFTTLPCTATPFDGDYPPRDPPIRFRKAIPTSWIELTLTEGKNRQVRRMTAAVGFPTLRLLRVKIGALELESLALSPGQWIELSPEQQTKVIVQGEPRRYKTR